MRAFRSIVWSCLAAVVLVGCQPTGPVMGGTPGPAHNKIVSLSPSTTELVARHGSINNLKGRTSACDFPSFVDRVPVVATTKPDFEKIAEIQPDLVVLDADLYNEQDMARIQQLGATNVFVFESHTVNGFVEELRQLARYIGGETNMSKYVDQIVAASETARAKNLGGTVKVMAMMGEPGRYLVAGTDSFLADVIRVAGGTPVGPSGKIFAPMGAEAIIGANPDVILVAGGAADEGMIMHDESETPNFTQRDANDTRFSEKILRDPQLQSVTAVRRGLVPSVASDVMLRRGSRVQDLIEAVSTVLVRAANSR